MFKLRELEQEDIPQINKWRNDKKLVDFLGAPYRYINISTDYRWYESYLKKRNEELRCAIVNSDETENRILGLVSLTNINMLNKSALFHIMIGDNSNRNKGMGFLATKEILAHGFFNMNLNRIELTVLSTNIRAIRLYEKVGFLTEGVKREAVYKNGEFQDMILMSILKKDYLNIHIRGNENER